MSEGEKRGERRKGVDMSEGEKRGERREERGCRYERV